MRRTLAIALGLFAACSAGSPKPAELDTKNDVCAYCRMPVSDASLAAQVVVRGEEPRFFDDIGCLRGFLARTRMKDAAVAFVADHRTRQWVRADRAVYTRARIETPMGSRMIAHANAASRDADSASAGGESIAAAEALAPVGAGAPDRREAR